MSIYQFDDDFNLIYKKQDDESFRVCKTCSSCSSCISNIYSCVSNIYSCMCLPLRLCMGLSWIATSGFFFYMGTIYNTEKDKLLNITTLH